MLIQASYMFHNFIDTNWFTNRVNTKFHSNQDGTDDIILLLPSCNAHKCMMGKTDGGVVQVNRPIIIWVMPYGVVQGKEHKRVMSGHKQNRKHREHGLKSSQRHYNECNGISNHRQPNCLLNPDFKRRSKKTSKLRVIGLCEGNPPVTGGFPSQRASDAESISIWWHHHTFSMFCFILMA